MEARIPVGHKCYQMVKSNNEEGYDVIPCPYFNWVLNDELIGKCDYLGILDVPKLNRQKKICDINLGDDE